MKKLLVVGGGGHAKVVIDLALRCGSWIVVGVLDDAPQLIGSTVLGMPVLGPTSSLGDLSDPHTSVVVAVGANLARQELQSRARRVGYDIAILVHPAAVVAESVRLGAGTVVMAGAVINADAAVGEGAIVNTGATIDHDCRLGDFCHVAPGVTLCGGVSVGARSLIGVGAAVIPGIEIGADVMVGAGATVVGAVSDGCRVVGVPAREVRAKTDAHES